MRITASARDESPKYRRNITKTVPAGAPTLQKGRVVITEKTEGRTGKRSSVEICSSMEEARPKTYLCRNRFMFSGPQIILGTVELSGELEPWNVCMVPEQKLQKLYDGISGSICELGKN